ncbi:hypothetical protein C1646_816069 [Rhizophagus diaphanus]|nr:hypothetical protein C1646_816069 [Rhizophagus diaphanus] [Rhizophagus sp. MUCL 43196]
MTPKVIILLRSQRTYESNNTIESKEDEEMEIGENIKSWILLSDAAKVPLEEKDQLILDEDECKELNLITRKITYCKTEEIISATTAQPQPQPQPQPQQQQQPQPQNLFEAFSQQQQQQQQQQQGGNVDALAGLRNQPQLQQLRQLVQQNPANTRFFGCIS